MRQTDDELRGILEGVAEAVVVEDPSGRIVYRNPAADALLGELPDLAGALGVSADVLPSRRVFAGEPSATARRPACRRPAVVAGELDRRGRARPAATGDQLDRGHHRHQARRGGPALPGRELARAGQLARSRRDAAAGRAPCRQLDRRPTGRSMSDRCPPRHRAVHRRAARADPGARRRGRRDQLSGAPVGPLETAVAEDLGLRVGAAVDLARVYRTRAGDRADAAGHAAAARPAADRGPGDRRRCTGRPRRGHELGGDFYDVFSTGPHAWFWSSATSAAEGAEAAAVSALARQHDPRGGDAAPLPGQGPAPAQRRDAGPGRARRFRRGRLRPARPRARVVAAATVACGGHPAPRILRATGAVEAFGARGHAARRARRRRAGGPHDPPARRRRADPLHRRTDSRPQRPRSWTPEQLHTILAAAVGQTAEGIVEHIAATVEGPVRDDLALLAVRVTPTD